MDKIIMFINNLLTEAEQLTAIQVERIGLVFF